MHISSNHTGYFLRISGFFFVIILFSRSRLHCQLFHSQKLHQALITIRNLLNCKEWLTHSKNDTYTNFRKFYDTRNKPGCTVCSLSTKSPSIEICWVFRRRFMTFCKYRFFCTLFVVLSLSFINSAGSYFDHYTSKQIIHYIRSPQAKTAFCNLYNVSFNTRDSIKFFSLVSFSSNIAISIVIHRSFFILFIGPQ